jgi:sulfate/thiosulfate transport system permease protein
VRTTHNRFRRVLPGFGISLGVTVGYATAIFLLPVAGLTLRAAGVGWPQLWRAISSPAALSAYRLTLVGAAAGALFNAVFGFIAAWVLVRYRFPLRGFFDVIVDMPFALPGAVGGLALAAVFASNGLLGPLLTPLGVQVAFAPLGIFVVYVFVGLPFVIRSVQPVLANLEYDEEEAAELLGAEPQQTFFRVILPAALPATITGATLAFARAIGDYGTVIFMAGNVPLRSEVVTRLIYNRFDQFDVPGATAVAAVMMLFSFLLLFMLNTLRTWSARRGGG